MSDVILCSIGSVETCDPTSSTFSIINITNNNTIKNLHNISIEINEIYYRRNTDHRWLKHKFENHRGQKKYSQASFHDRITLKKLFFINISAPFVRRVASQVCKKLKNLGKNIVENYINNMSFFNYNKSNDYRGIGTIGTMNLKRNFCNALKWSKEPPKMNVCVFVYLCPLCVPKRLDRLRKNLVQR